MLGDQLTHWLKIGGNCVEGSGPELLDDLGDDDAGDDGPDDDCRVKDW